jgi:phi13 family phage major tail protein
MPQSVKANRFNIKRIVYSVISKDDASAFNYGTIKKFADPMQVQYTPTLATGIQYGGGVKTEDMSKMTGGVLQVDVNKIPIEVRAEILGHTYAAGVLTEKPSDQPKDIAIGYELDETGDNTELVWLYKCKAKPFASSTQQTTENINFSQDTLNIGVMPRVFDGAIRAFGDTANADFTPEMATAFLATIPGGTLVVV